MSEVKNKLAAKANGGVQKAQPKSIKEWIVAMKPQIEKALPSVITADRFSRMALTAVSTNPELGNCTPESFCGAMMQAAQLGLEPNTPLGQAYLIPYRNNKKGGVMEAQFQLGYKGLIGLAHRSGEFKNIEAHTVFEGDDFEYEYGLEPKLYHKPALTNRGEPIAYYAVYNLTNGGFGFEVMSREDVAAHRKKYSKARFSPWDTAFDEMAKKTVLKKVLKYAPISVEFQKGVQADETIKTEISEDMVDIPAQEVEIEVIDEETGEVNE